ncbi:MAG: hypothetical protein K9H25_04025 [Rhodospirillum sp.]|nr:hypothetical protein [Rhodospirillum sp.]MCF8488840.1 hypothetical protein [Rhodospirillum sp.]MCF8501325.1 hypothetical protein [Rhodospirillum sp.]
MSPRPEEPRNAPREDAGTGSLDNRDTRFRKGLEGASGGPGLAVWGLFALAALVGLSLFFDF